MLKKFAVLLSAAAILSFSGEPIKALANEVQNTNVTSISAQNTEDTKAVKEGDYISDLNWKVATTDLGTITKDKNSEGNPLRLLLEEGQVAKYEKGIGVRGNSTIVYDIKDKGYIAFQAQVGVDYKNAGNPSSSVIFEVYVDGEKAFESNAMKADSLLEHVYVPLDNASEIKLVVKDDGNGAQGNWANASLNHIESEELGCTIEKVEN